MLENYKWEQIKAVKETNKGERTIWATYHLTPSPCRTRRPLFEGVLGMNLHHLLGKGTQKISSTLSSVGDAFIPVSSAGVSAVKWNRPVECSGKFYPPGNVARVVTLTIYASLWPLHCTFFPFFFFKFKLMCPGSEITHKSRMIFLSFFKIIIAHLQMLLILLNATLMYLILGPFTWSTSTY